MKGIKDLFTVPGDGNEYKLLYKTPIDEELVSTSLRIEIETRWPYICFLGSSIISALYIKDGKMYSIASNTTPTRLPYNLSKPFANMQDDEIVSIMDIVYEFCVNYNIAHVYVLEHNKDLDLYIHCIRGHEQMYKEFVVSMKNNTIWTVGDLMIQAENNKKVEIWKGLK